MKRVLFVDHVDLILGGAEINLIELLSVPEASGRWEVGCACAPSGPLRDALGKCPRVQLFRYTASVEFNRFRLVGCRGSLSKIWSGWRSVRRAAAELEDIRAAFRPDALVSCANKDHFASAFLRSSESTRAFWWVNDLLTPDFFSWPARRLFSLMATRRATGLVAVSRAVAQALVDAGVPSRNVRTIPNGIPVESYSRPASGRLRSIIGAGNPLVGVLGRFTPWKGQHVALDIVRQCVSRGQAVHFVFVGRAFNEDQEYEAELHKFVARHNLSSSVTFMPFQSDVASVLADLDIVLHTSVKPEPFGRVIIEAMAAGAIVIAAAAGGVKEIIESGSTGFLVDPGDVPAYVDAIQQALGNPARRRAMIAAAKLAVKSQFSVERVFEQFDELITSLKP